MCFKVFAVVLFFGYAGVEFSGAQIVESQPDSSSPTPSPSVAKTSVREKAPPQPSVSPPREGATETRDESASTVATASPRPSLPPLKSHRHARVRAAAAEAPIAATVKPAAKRSLLGAIFGKKRRPVPVAVAVPTEESTPTPPRRKRSSAPAAAIPSAPTDRTFVREIDRPATDPAPPAEGPAASTPTPAPTGQSARSANPIAPSVRPTPAAQVEVSTAATSSTPPEASSTGATVTIIPAPGGGPGQVWVNTRTHVYHKQGSRFYGTTKHGKYLSEQEALKEGARPAILTDRFITPPE